MRAARTLALAVVLAGTGASAQPVLRLHEAVTAEAPGDTTGMHRLNADAGPVWIGPAVLELGPAQVRTVGLEEDPDGTAALSLWLDAEATAAFADITGRRVGRALAVVYAGRVLTAPTVDAPVSNGYVPIAGLLPAEGLGLADAFREARRTESVLDPPAWRPVRLPSPLDADVPAPPRVDPARTSPPRFPDGRPVNRSGAGEHGADSTPTPPTPETAEASALDTRSAVSLRDGHTIAGAPTSSGL